MALLIEKIQGVGCGLGVDMGLHFEVRYGSHLPMLIKALSITNGDVLELGTGVFSTPILHYMCVPNKRMLYSYDNDPYYLNIFSKQDISEFHKFVLVEDWDKADIDRPWDVVLVDHAPGERRVVEIKRLAKLAKFIIVHDSGWKDERHYHYKENKIRESFLYYYEYDLVKPNTLVLSNFVNVKELL